MCRLSIELGRRVKQAALWDPRRGKTLEMHVFVLEMKASLIETKFCQVNLCAACCMT